MSNENIEFESVEGLSRNKLIKRAHEVFEGSYINNWLPYVIGVVEKTNGSKVVALVTAPKTHQGIVYHNRTLKSFGMDLTVYTFLHASVDSLHDYDMGVMKPDESFDQFLARKLREHMPMIT